MQFLKRHKTIVPFQRTLSAAFLTAGFITLISLQPWGEKIENVLARPAEFSFRRWLKKDPPLDPRLQIYVVEDSTVQYLKRENLKLADWSALIDGFKNQNPRAVFIDKIFGIPNENAEAAAFISKVKELPFPVIAGAFVVPSSIQSRPLLPTYNLLDKIVSGSSTNPKGADDLDWIAIEPGYPYGPAENLREAFRYIGHIMYGGDTYFKPMIRISTYQGLPSSTLLTAKDLHLGKDQLVVDGSVIPMDRKGRALINFVSPSLFYDRTDAIMKLFEIQKAKKPFPKIPEDSIIAFLPQQFTGNIDYKETPFGSYPGGYAICSIINSVLTGKWLKILPYHWAVTLLVGTATSFLLFFLSGYTFWLVVFGLILSFVVSGLLCFSHLSLTVPWLYSSLSVFFSAFVVFAMNAREVLRRRTEGVAGTATPIEVRYDEKTGQPKKLGRYHVMERIGKGGMGEVYRAKIYGAGGFEKEFALKRMAPEYWKDKTVVQSFLDEAKLSGFLNHRNIVQVFELLRVEDSYLLVMEYVKGRSLSDVVSTLKKTGAKLPPELAAYIVRQVCQALDYAHASTDPSSGRPLKLIHRDISPHNILLSFDGSIKLIDFGIAKATLTTEHTKTGFIKGKLAYMSPEQAAAKPIDRRSDIFSTSLVLYELLTGKRALGEDSNSEIRTLKQAKEWEAHALQLTTFNVPETLKKILLKGLQREPEQRYQKAEEMYSALSDFLAERHFGIGEKALSEFLANLSALEKGATTNDRTVVSEIEIEDRKTG